MTDNRKAWWSLAALCLGLLMVSLNATVVTVALPSIGVALGFSQASLSWVINAYLVMLGGFLLLGGRIGDLFGRRRLFLVGVATFTLASLGCAVARAPTLLLVGRAAQGLGGAVVMAMVLSHVTSSFPDGPQRARALGVYAFVNAAAGSLGVLLGGVLIGALGWRSIFFVNIPVGVAVYVLSANLLPADASTRKSGVQPALIPLQLFRLRSVVVANIAGAIFSSALLSWNFASTLYLQQVLQLTPMQVGLAFLPANATAALMALIVAPKLVVRLGVRRAFITGTALTGVGLMLFARAPVNAQFALDVLPAMILLGLGSGITFNPLLLTAVSAVPPGDSGVASGLVNTSLRMGGAIGLSMIASIAAARTSELAASGAPTAVALTGGYQLAFGVAAAFALISCLIGASLTPAERVSTISDPRRRSVQWPRS